MCKRTHPISHKPQNPDPVIEKVDWKSLPGLKQALADQKAGRVSRPFTNMKDLLRSLRGDNK